MGQFDHGVSLRGGLKRHFEGLNIVVTLDGHAEVIFYVRSLYSIVVTFVQRVRVVTLGSYRIG